MCIVCNSENPYIANEVLEKEYILQKAVREYKQSLKKFVDSFKDNLDMKSKYKYYYYQFIKEGKKLNKFINTRN